MEQASRVVDQSDNAADSDTGYTSKLKQIVSDVKRFDQKYTMFNRPRWDPKVQHLAAGIYGVVPTKETDGDTLIDRAFHNAGWFVEMAFAHGHAIHGRDLYSWDKKPYSDCLRLPKGEKLEGYDPVELTRRVKKVCRALGADLVGICKLDTRWIYSRWYDLGSMKEGPLDVPSECTNVIVMATEMDYEMFRTSPKQVQSATTGLGYSMMGFVAGSVAHFIRDLGYTAIPSGNDTALNVPLALEAGLGELGRHGIVITERFGPRVRLFKVLTDLPLVPDEPMEFGVERFCETCMKCADKCPSNAITHGTRTDEALNESSGTGVLKWPVDGEKCFAFWSANHGGCGNCIRVCPFNKPDTWIHKAVRWHVQKLPQFNSVYRKIDDLFGYGRHLLSEDWWNNDRNVT